MLSSDMNYYQAVKYIINNLKYDNNLNNSSFKKYLLDSIGEKFSSRGLKVPKEWGDEVTGTLPTSEIEKFLKRYNTLYLQERDKFLDPDEDEKSEFFGNQDELTFQLKEWLNRVTDNSKGESSSPRSSSSSKKSEEEKETQEERNLRDLAEQEGISLKELIRQQKEILNSKNSDNEAHFKIIEKPEVSNDKSLLSPTKDQFEKNLSDFEIEKFSPKSSKEELKPTEEQKILEEQRRRELSKPMKNKYKTQNENEIKRRNKEWLLNHLNKSLITNIEHPNLKDEPFHIGNQKDLAKKRNTYSEFEKPKMLGSLFYPEHYFENGSEENPSIDLDLYHPLHKTAMKTIIKTKKPVKLLSKFSPNEINDLYKNPFRLFENRHLIEAIELINNGYKFNPVNRTFNHTGHESKIIPEDKFNNLKNYHQQIEKLNKKRKSDDKYARTGFYEDMDEIKKNMINEGLNIDKTRDNILDFIGHPKSEKKLIVGVDKPHRYVTLKYPTTGGKVADVLMKNNFIPKQSPGGSGDHMTYKDHLDNLVTIPDHDKNKFKYGTFRSIIEPFGFKPTADRGIFEYDSDPDAI